MAKILVIDDVEAQRAHALKVLVGHEVVVAKNWSEGAEAIEKGGWDIVLTDLSMPAERAGQGDKGLRYLGEPTPYGFALALLALKSGVAKVAIVSNGQGEDGNHHAHPIFWAADDLDGVIIPGRLWAFTGYRCPHMNEKSLPGVEGPYLIKDWAKVLSVVVA